MGLPTPPPEAWWQIDGKPTAPWTWIHEHATLHDDNGQILTVLALTEASAGEASATLRWKGDGR